MLPTQRDDSCIGIDGGVDKPPSVRLFQWWNVLLARDSVLVRPGGDCGVGWVLRESGRRNHAPNPLRKGLQETHKPPLSV